MAILRPERHLQAAPLQQRKILVEFVRETGITIRLRNVVINHQDIASARGCDRAPASRRGRAASSRARRATSFQRSKKNLVVLDLDRP